MLVACLFGKVADAQDYPTATVAPNMSRWKHASTGVVYVPQALLEEYQDKKRTYDGLRADVSSALPNALTIRNKILALRKELDAIESTMETASVLAEPYSVYKQRITESYELSETRHILILGDDVIVRGWNGDKIKCVVEKFVLSEEEPDDSEFDAIKIEHDVRQADDLVGLSDKDRAAQERKFLASEDGRKLDEAARQRRAKFVAEIHNSYRMYRTVQGQAINVLKFIGLRGNEGNQHLTGATKSPGGGGTVGGFWKRSARFTIYVPECETVVIQGCQKHVDIKSIQANLIVTNHNSQDRAYDGQFAIQDVQGDVTIHQAPIRLVENVRGNLSMVQTNEFTNTSTSHRGRLRTTSSPMPNPTFVRQVEGRFEGQFVRADLYIDQVGGKLDVVNDYGNTDVVLDKPLLESSHRVISHSGVIRAVMPQATTVQVPLYAFTQTGAVQIAFDRNKFDDRSFGVGETGRSWYGFQTTTPNQPFFTGMDRPKHAWENTQREPGIDLISNAGAVVLGPAVQKKQQGER